MDGWMDELNAGAWNDFMDWQSIYLWMDDEFKSIKMGRLLRKKCRCMEGIFHDLYTSPDPYPEALNTGKYLPNFPSSHFSFPTLLLITVRTCKDRYMGFLDTRLKAFIRCCWCLLAQTSPWHCIISIIRPAGLSPGSMLVALIHIWTWQLAAVSLIKWLCWKERLACPLLLALHQISVGETWRATSQQTPLNQK